MSLLNAILEKLGLATAATTTQSTAAPSASAANTSTASGTTGSAAPKAVDVTAKLDQMAASNAQKLNWKSSIVDLLKLLNLDSSLDARKKLAQELGYHGALDGSAEMNMWLHQAVLQKLADNGGNIPQALLG